ncbi:GSU2403 family nucleotidyltransferase fold protein [Diaphorobacter limosus]|uniref:GSU2403 family nucleotidyltransferase fold protein n=1 Tax=Diaphorobacter limosus TaxID=3036128 RepID=A0ABZ0J1T3_9BURK|nr:GSU2403 family nucleotidyltransferase fold protein [Diaphorobacter sp. Y-1]WOO31808.1 GSU2403 family nucleotidyltransferase fold protein [Diaphorobacter sp. Y-1]
MEPSSFVAFKHWLAAQAPHRTAPKRRRDQRQAEIVQALLDEKMLFAKDDG